MGALLPSVIFNVWDYGAAPYPIDSTQAFQNAAEAAIANYGILYIPNGHYRCDTLDLTGIAEVSNGGPFGLTVAGQGRGSLVTSFLESGVFLNLDAGSSDLQINIKDVSFANTGGAIGVLVGTLKRYSLWENVRFYGFREGFRWRRPTWGITFRDLFIRGCREEAMIIDPATVVAPHTINEVHFRGGYIDNNGSSVVDGGSYVPVMRLENASRWSFSGTVLEGNFGGGVQISGASEQILFNNCRLEETLVRFGSGGHIHNVGSEVKYVSFVDCDLSYDLGGVSGDKHYNLLYAGGGSEVRFVRSRFLDASNSNPSDVFGASVGNIVCSDCWSGRGGLYGVQNIGV